jgi:hypothetical protein
MINAKAGNGITGGGKEMQGDLNLARDSVTQQRRDSNSQPPKRYKGAGTSQTTANVITGGDVVLEAGGCSVGKSDSPVYTAISEDGMLTARADKNVYISQVAIGKRKSDLERRASVSDSWKCAGSENFQYLCTDR